MSEESLEQKSKLILENKILLSEGFVNLFTPKDKKKYANEVWEILQSSYSQIGGLKGSGFKSQDDMIKSIPMWKLGTRDGKVRAVVMYKDKQGRKSVATGTDGSKEGKELVKDIIKGDFSRSFGERSGPLLRFIEKNFPDLVKKYAIPVSEVDKYLDGKEFTPVDKFKYTRKIGGKEITKMMMGTPGKTII